MITVKIDQDKRELCLIRIQAQEVGLDGDVPIVRYTAEFVVDRDGATGIHSRVFIMQDDIAAQSNVLAILKAAIESLDKEALELESK